MKLRTPILLLVTVAITLTAFVPTADAIRRRAAVDQYTSFENVGSATGAVDLAGTFTAKELRNLRRMLGRPAEKFSVGADGEVTPGDTITFTGDGCTPELLSKLTSFRINVRANRNHPTKEVGRRIGVLRFTVPPTTVRCGSLDIEVGAEPEVVEGANADMADDTVDIEMDAINDGTAADFDQALALAGASESSEAGTDVLPRTGGEFAWLVGGLLVLMGAALGLRRATRPRSSAGPDA